MRVIFGVIFLALFTCLYNNSYAQGAGSLIWGKVLTDTRQPAQSTTIVLLKYSDSSIVSSTIIEKNGQYKFIGVLPGKYLLLITKKGYNKIYEGPYSVVEGKNLTLDDIILNSLIQQLQEVSIVSNKPPVEVRPGKITLNIQNNINTAGNSALDILRQSPGVRVDMNNVISIIGRQAALITIDGKITNLSGEDLVSVLRTLQANTIDRIELITNGPAKYDASSGGVINVVLKKGSNIGANATVTETVGYGKYYKDNTGIVFNDRTEKFNIFGNYNYSTNKSFHDFTGDRVINFDNVSSDYDGDYHAVQISTTNSFNIGADYFLTPKQTIGFLVNGAFLHDSYTKSNNLNISNQSVLDSIITTNSNVNRHINRVNYNLNYNNKLDSSGMTLSADLNYTTYNRSSAEYITNDFYDASGNPYNDPLLQRNLSPSNIRIWLSKVDFSDPLTKTSKLEAGIEYTNTTSNNDLIFGPLVNGVYQNDPMFTNHFVYTENINAGYVNYENKFNKFDLTAGLRAEQTISRGNSVTSNEVTYNNYVNIFPSALLTYQKDDKNQLSFSYSRGITRPDYALLNPFLYYIDRYDYRSGNPYLKPSYANTIELSYNYNQTLTATLYSNVTNNAYDFLVYDQNDTTKVNVSTNKNFGDIYSYGVRFFAPVTFTSWWNANFNVDAAYQRYVAYPSIGNLDKGTQDIVFTSTQDFIITKTLSAQIYGYYETPSFYGVVQYKSNYYVNAGLSQQLFNKRGSLKLAVSDIFNTQRDRGRSDYDGLDYSVVDKRETQVARLTFTYRFGKISVKNVTHHTGNEDEQKRTASRN